MPQVLRLLFERSGSRMETPSQVLYGVNSAGLSLSNRRLLSEGTQGLCAMSVQEKGKPVHVRLKDLPPCGGFCQGPIACLFLRKLSEVRLDIYSHVSLELEKRAASRLNAALIEGKLSGLQ